MADSTYFKVYMSDVGLLRRKSNVNYRTILEGDAAYIHYKGALTENYVFTQLKCMGMESYFWRTKADAEIDFISDYEGVLLPIEVKSADNTKAKSLHFLILHHFLAFGPTVVYNVESIRNSIRILKERHK